MAKQPTVTKQAVLVTTTSADSSQRSHNKQPPLPVATVQATNQASAAAQPPLAPVVSTQTQQTSTPQASVAPVLRTEPVKSFPQPRLHHPHHPHHQPGPAQQPKPKPAPKVPPVLSVVVSSGAFENDPTAVAAIVDSLRNQVHVDFEVVFVDDGNGALAKQVASVGDNRFFVFKGARVWPIEQANGSVVLVLGPKHAEMCRDVRFLRLIADGKQAKHG